MPELEGKYDIRMALPGAEIIVIVASIEPNNPAPKNQTAGFPVASFFVTNPQLTLSARITIKVGENDSLMPPRPNVIRKDAMFHNVKAVLFHSFLIINKNTPR